MKKEDFGISKDSFNKTEESGILTYTCESNALKDKKIEIFGEEKVKEYEEAKKVYMESMIDVGKELIADGIKSGSSEVQVKFNADDCKTTMYANETKNEDDERLIDLMIKYEETVNIPEAIQIKEQILELIK